MLTSDEFSFNMADVDRDALLDEAASTFTALDAYMSDSKTSTADSPAAEMANAMREDTAEFAGYPVVQKITDEVYLARHKEIPESFKNLAKQYDYYWIYVPIALFPRHGWRFNRLEVRMVFSPEMKDDHARPRAYQILPARQFETVLEANGRVEVHLNENLQFTAGTGEVPIQAGSIEGKLEAGVDAAAAAAAGLVMGPFVYRLRKAQIDHTATGLEKVFWRLDGSQFFEDNIPQLVVIAQVPKATKSMRVVAAMQAYRYFNTLSGGIRNTITQAPEGILRFFQGGAPIPDDADWDLSDKLT